MTETIKNICPENEHDWDLVGIVIKKQYHYICPNCLEEKIVTEDQLKNLLGAEFLSKDIKNKFLRALELDNESD